MVEILEKSAGPERSREIAPQEKEASEVTSREGGEKTLVLAISDDNTPAAVPHDEELVIIESILEEDLRDLYLGLPAGRQMSFKKQGEIAALKIRGLLMAASVKVHEILEIIKKWLLMIPGVSHYFTEQEAKIKTDKILAMKKEGQEIEK